MASGDETGGSPVCSRLASRRRRGPRRSRRHHRSRHCRPAPAAPAARATAASATAVRPPWSSPAVGVARSGGRRPGGRSSSNGDGVVPADPDAGPRRGRSRFAAFGRASRTRGPSGADAEPAGLRRRGRLDPGPGRQSARGRSSRARSRWRRARRLPRARGQARDAQQNESFRVMSPPRGRVVRLTPSGSGAIGNRTSARAPPPGRLTSVALPPQRRASVSTIARPSPVPGTAPPWLWSAPGRSDRRRGRLRRRRGRDRGRAPRRTPARVRGPTQAPAAGPAAL